MKSSGPIELTTWTDLRTRVAEAVRLDRTICLALAMSCTVVIIAAGILLVHSPVRWSSLLYGPLIGWGLWGAVHGRAAELRLKSRLMPLTRAVTLSLVPSVSTKDLIRLVMNDAVPVGAVRLQINVVNGAVRVEAVDLEVPPPNLGQIYRGGSGMGGSGS